MNNLFKFLNILLVVTLWIFLFLSGYSFYDVAINYNQYPFGMEGGGMRYASWQLYLAFLFMEMVAILVGLIVPNKIDGEKEKMLCRLLVIILIAIMVCMF